MKNKKHILVISQYFYPEQFRINDICAEWVKRGYKVTVITGIPNYPQGHFYHGYNFLKNRKDIYHGVNVIRLPIIPRGNNKVTLALNYVSFVISGYIWNFFTNYEADHVFIFQMSPMTQALLGIWYAKKRKITCHIYVQDLWPETVEAILGKQHTRLIKSIDKMVEYIYDNCNLILGTSISYVKKIEERKTAYTENGESKVKYWPQYAENFYRPVKKESLFDMPEDDRFKIVFTGNIGYAQGLDILPRAAVLLQERNIDCRFIIIGDGSYRAEFEKEIQKKHIEDMFLMLGRKSPEEIPGYLAHCNVAFISFADDPLYKMIIPAKLQSYMACGMPVLAVAEGETQRIIEDAKCGMASPLGDEEALIGCISKFIKASPQTINEMKQNALKYSDKYFNKKRLLDEMDQYI